MQNILVRSICKVMSGFYIRNVGFPRYRHIDGSSEDPIQLPTRSISRLLIEDIVARA